MSRIERKLDVARRKEHQQNVEKARSERSKKDTVEKVDGVKNQ